MASGAFQMTDECRCHGDGANEALIWGAVLADGCESHAETTQKFFKYHLVFITQTYTRASAAPIPLLLRLFTSSIETVTRQARWPPSAQSWPREGGGSWETHFGHR